MYKLAQNVSFYKEIVDGEVILPIDKLNKYLEELGDKVHSVQFIENRYVDTDAAINGDVTASDYLIVTNETEYAEPRIGAVVYMLGKADPQFLVSYVLKEQPDRNRGIFAIADQLGITRRVEWAAHEWYIVTSP